MTDHPYDALVRQYGVTGFEPAKPDWNIPGSVVVGSLDALVACLWFKEAQTARQRSILKKLLLSLIEPRAEGFDWLTGSHLKWLPGAIGTAMQNDAGPYLKATLGAGVLFHRSYWREALGATMLELFARGDIDPFAYFNIKEEINA